MPLESTIQRNIIKALRAEGIWAGKINVEGRAGYPDVLAMRNGKVCLIEVKRDEAARRANTDTSALQAVRREELAGFGIESTVVITWRKRCGSPAGFSRLRIPIT